MSLLLRYTQALITQMSQTSVCNRYHTLGQQLCRWLLLSLDRLKGSELVMPLELIANILGVGREGVTESILKFSTPDSSATPGAASKCWTARAWNNGPASATQWSRRNTTTCCRIMKLHNSREIHWTTGRQNCGVSGVRRRKCNR